MSFKKFFFLLLVFSLVIIIKYYADKDEKKSAEIILKKSNVSFIGNVISYDRSMDRAFGIIKFKVIKSNKEDFNISDPKLMYPYRIEHGYGEFYGYVPITRQMRQQLIDLFSTYKARVKIVYLEVPFKQLHMQNKAREAQVPSAVIDKLIDKLEVPALHEACIVEYEGG